MADEKPAKAETPAAEEPKAKAAEAKKPAAKTKAAEAKKPAAKTKESKSETAEKPKRTRRAPAAKAEAKADEKEAKADDKAGAKADGKAAETKADKAPAKRSKPAAKAPSARSRARSGHAGQAGRRTVVRAQAKYVRTSARKARMVCGHLRGKSVAEARAILAFTPRQVARDWGKLLDSAVANAENNHELVEEDLIVHEAYADEGPTIKRFRPRARGRASSIRKRTSHLTITLTPGP